MTTIPNGHPKYKAPILENDIIVFDIPIMRGYSSNDARFYVLQGWPYKYKKDHDIEKILLKIKIPYIETCLFF